MLIGISSSFDLDARLNEFLVIIGEPLGARGIVGQEEKGQKGTEDCNQTLDDELETCQLVFIDGDTPLGRVVDVHVKTEQDLPTNGSLQVQRHHSCGRHRLERVSAR